LYHRYKLKEPTEWNLSQRKPVLVSRLMELHLTELGYTLEELQRPLCMFADYLIKL
jgi:hypothetical protein